jgi:hypothetical protein
LAHQLYLATKSHLISSLLQRLIHYGRLAQRQNANNTAEYEAYLTDLAITRKIIIMYWKIEDAQRHEDCYTRGLTTLGSQVINQSIDASITDLLRKEFEEFSSYHED